MISNRARLTTIKVGDSVRFGSHHDMHGDTGRVTQISGGYIIVKIDGHFLKTIASRTDLELIVFQEGDYEYV